MRGIIISRRDCGVFEVQPEDGSAPTTAIYLAPGWIPENEQVMPKIGDRVPLFKVLNPDDAGGIFTEPYCF